MYWLLKTNCHFIVHSHNYAISRFSSSCKNPPQFFSSEKKWNFSTYLNFQTNESIFDQWQPDLNVMLCHEDISVTRGGVNAPWGICTPPPKPKRLLTT